LSEALVFMYTYGRLEPMLLEYSRHHPPVPAA
jgi:hypothetical protein